MRGDVGIQALQHRCVEAHGRGRSAHHYNVGERRRPTQRWRSSPTSVTARSRFTDRQPPRCGPVPSHWPRDNLARSMSSTSSQAPAAAGGCRRSRTGEQQQAGLGNIVATFAEHRSDALQTGKFGAAERPVPRFGIPRGRSGVDQCLEPHCRGLAALEAELDSLSA